MPGGRPTDYNEELLEKAKSYLDTTEKELPSVASLAIFLGVARSSIYEWAEKHEEFSDILEKILAEQEKRLTNNGLTGKWNSTITKLILTKHGYSDKQDLNADVQGDINIKWQ